METKTKWKVRVVLSVYQDDWINDYYREIKVENKSSGKCHMEGILSDISQAYGFILKLRDMNLVFEKLEIEKI